MTMIVRFLNLYDVKLSKRGLKAYLAMGLGDVSYPKAVTPARGMRKS